MVAPVVRLLSLPNFRKLSHSVSVMLRDRCSSFVEASTQSFLLPDLELVALGGDGELALGPVVPRLRAPGSFPTPFSPCVFCCYFYAFSTTLFHVPPEEEETAWAPLGMMMILAMIE